MKKALICGSFDPVTSGHASLIRRAARLFDEVEVVIFENSEKRYLFPLEARLSFLQRVAAACGENVRASAAAGTVAAYAKENGFACILKGVRNANDLVYEQDMAALNRLAGAPETLFLPTEPSYAHVSSSAVREFLRHGLPAEELLPAEACEEILATYRALCKNT
ncbi:MAG: pantetheine-phosphate adenylyltransferase [Clostridia bacterium]|nr:pantetheine-phosphate adenylyltransferase [Clostridia bacterium]